VIAGSPFIAESLGLENSHEHDIESQISCEPIWQRFPHLIIKEREKGRAGELGESSSARQVFRSRALQLMAEIQKGNSDEALQWQIG
jgi:hypothetical protein